MNKRPTTFVYNPNKVSPMVEALLGTKFGRLTLIKNLGYIASSIDANLFLVELKCECGNHIICPIGSIKKGSTKSCGCLAKESTSARSTTHGHKNRLTYGENGSKLYFTWTAIKQRCLNPNNHAYHRYGGRGIKICDRWKHSFENFLSDMNDSYISGYSLDRIDNDGNYCPENCRWATQKEQANNVSTNRILEFNGERLTFTQAAEKYKVSISALYARLDKYKWGIERALLTPTAKDTIVEYKNEKITITELAKRLGINVATFRGRILRYKWDVEKAINYPIRKDNRIYGRGFINKLKA